MKTILTLVFFGSALFSFGQTEKLNQFDKEGKEDGKWIIFLDSKGDKLKDSANAAYCRYTYFDHGVNIYPMSGFITNGGKIEHAPSNTESSSKMKLLDGVNINA